MKNITYATGKRKDAIARVWVKPKSKKAITVNGKSPIEYFCRSDLVSSLTLPLRIAELEETTEVKVTVCGGGISGQAYAIRLGIARALSRYDAELRSPLKKAGLLTRDARIVERKKYGRPKARKRFQFSKR